MNEKTQLFMKTYTWPRQSHGLLDYESHTLLKQSLQTKFPTGTIARRGEIVYHSDLSQKFPEAQSLVRIKNRNDQMILKKGKDVDKMLLVVKTLPKGYRIYEGDVIQFGRVAFTVEEIQIKDYEAPKSLSYKYISSRKLSLGGVTGPSKAEFDFETERSERNSNSNLQCRICLCEGDEISPLISVCAWSGSMKYCHLSCLQIWLKEKQSTRTRQNSKSYHLTSFACEICKQAFPLSIKSNGEKYDLIKIDRPTWNYLMLQSVTEDGTNFAVHIINLNDKDCFTVGRSRDQDIRIQDISVSRDHSYIRKTDSGLILYDNESKFGTLVQIQKPILLNLRSSFGVQCGRTYLWFLMKRYWSIGSWFPWLRLLFNKKKTTYAAKEITTSCENEINSPKISNHALKNQDEFDHIFPHQRSNSTFNFEMSGNIPGRRSDVTDRGSPERVINPFL